LADELGLQNLEREKNYCDWDDCKVAMRYSIESDVHQYRDNRYKAQWHFITLIQCDDGERIGAVARSDCYREEEVALFYEVMKCGYSQPDTLTVE